jgi:hypothetical protein
MHRAFNALALLVSLGSHADGPGVRNGHGLASDGKGVVLFGGADARAVRGDTWRWNGSHWMQLASSGPSPRTFPAMVSTGEQVLLFGGRRVLFGADGAHDTVLADTWLWDGATWREVTGPGPPARAEAAAAYDPRRNRVVLFGGYTDVGTERRKLDDTWEWDGMAWKRLPVSGPSARNGATMAFDPLNARIVLFGGGPVVGGASPETWEWDGVRWQRSATEAPGRYNSASASVDDGILRFGGWDGKGRVAETWRFRSGKWTLLSTPGPSARNHTVLAADARRGRVVLFGGHDGEHVFGDTWEWDGSRWTRMADRPPELRVENGH